ncbi:hypothetical protein BC833DRAFT_604080 [Globomyces pollinis-pini]|nr:hypothetical protein BC833DRAFT_604080 [Globomyces pollinis-pini]
MATDILTFNHELILSNQNDFKQQRTILIPIDESKNTLKFIEHAMNLLLNPKTDLIVLLHARTMQTSHVFLSLISPSSQPASMQMNLSTFMEQEKQESKELLEKLAKKLIANQFHVRAISTSGDARQVIDHKTELIHPDFIIMSNHSKGIVGRTLLGSVSQHVLNYSKVPVVIVPVQSLV